MRAEYKTKKAVAASAAKRTAQGVRFMACAVCGKQIRRWVSQINRAKLPMTCGVGCRKKAMQGANNPRWTGGVWKENREGYRMARIIGRPLRTEEHVHHRNGIKDDNRPENLMLMDWANHSKEHRILEREMLRLMAENAELRNALA